jgi:hypothetical protein
MMSTVEWVKDVCQKEDRRWIEKVLDAASDCFDDYGAGSARRSWTLELQFKG